MHTELPGSRRLDFIDAMRFVAMVQMLQGHAISSLVSASELDLSSPPLIIWNALRGLTAPIFLILSGIVNALALRRSETGVITGQYVRRRLLWVLGLMALAYYFVLPAGNLDGLLRIDPQNWVAFFQVHILQLNAVSLLFLVVMALLTRSDRALARCAFVVSVVIISLTPLVYSHDWSAMLPEALAAYLTPAHGSFFPIFPYSAYLFLGISIGVFLKNLSADVAQKKFRDIIPKIALSSLVLAVILHFFIPASKIAKKYSVEPSFIFFILGFSLVILWALGCLWKHLPSISRVCAPLGRRTLLIFVMHLFFLYELPRRIGIQKLCSANLTLSEGLLAALLLLFSCFGLAALSNWLRKSDKRKGDIFRFAIGALIIGRFFW